MAMIRPPAPSTAVAAVVLAGGASVRMGGSPKALLPVRGIPAVVRMVRICSDAGLSPVVVVAGAHRAAIRVALHGSDAVVVDHPGWASGRTGSIQAGLATIGSASAALLWPIDHPFVTAETVRGLLARGDQDRLALWVIPTFEGRGGHPIVLRHELFASIQQLRPDQALRSLLGRLGPQVLRAAVPDRGVVENVDTRQSYKAAVERSRGETGVETWTES
jgi:molybdenum cofactor cytidylyltransferase